jgi:hypothetical protein
MNATIIIFITYTGMCDLSYFFDIKKKLTAITRHVKELIKHKTEEAFTIPSSEMIEERSINVPPTTSMTAASFKKDIDITMN